MARAAIEPVLAIFPCLLCALVHPASSSSVTCRQFLAGTYGQNLGLGGLSSMFPYHCLFCGGGFLGLVLLNLRSKIHSDGRLPKRQLFDIFLNERFEAY